MRSSNYTQPRLAQALDRHALRRDAHFVGMSLIAVIVCMQFLSAIPLYLLGGLGVLDLQNTETWGLSSDGYAMVNMALYLVNLLPPVAVVSLLCRRKINPFSEHRRISPVLFVCMVGVGLAVCMLANYIASFAASIFAQFGIGWPDAADGMEPTLSSLLIHLVSTALLPGLIEELVFRGYILQSLRRYGDGFAVVVSAVLFGLLHGNVLQIPFAFFVGLICGYAVVQTGNIWVAIAIHAINNGMAVVVGVLTPALTPEGLVQLNTTFTLLFSVVGVACFLALRAIGSPLLDRPSGGWTSLSRKEKWGTLFSSPAFTVAVVLMGLVTVIITASYSAM